MEYDFVELTFFNLTADLMVVLYDILVHALAPLGISSATPAIFDIATKHATLDASVCLVL